MWETSKVTKAKDRQVPVERRRTADRRTAEDRRRKQEPVAVERRTTTRRKVQRRRQIDPTTCERDYTPDEIEFMHALDAYKRANGRMFPTCSEILEVVRNLGYSRATADAPPSAAAPAGEDAPSAASDTQPLPPQPLPPQP